MVQLVPKGVISTPKVIHFQTAPEPKKTTVPQGRIIVELPTSQTFEIETIEQVPDQGMSIEEETHIIEEQVLEESLSELPSEALEASIEIGDVPSSAENSIVLEISEANTRRLTESGQIRYFCPQCNVRYTKYKYLKTHIKDCGTEFSCAACNAKFKQRRTYVAHVKQKHDSPGSVGKKEIKTELQTESA